MSAGEHTLPGIVLVLDRPRDPLNVGAVVRLMGNFGLPCLRLVEPAAFDPAQVLRLARRGQAVLDGIRRYPSLPDALADCGYVIGTTRRVRAIARPVLTPEEAAPVLLAARDEGRPAAVIFGPEDFGLDNAALDRCHALLTIPAVPEDASLNLAQAALLVAYELRRAALQVNPVGTEARAPSERIAQGADLEAMFSGLHAMLEAMHPVQIPGRTDHAMARLRALLMRAQPSEADARLLAGIFQHVAHGLLDPRDGP
ncbi:MAG TPA: TrmH family RNA methyltransferase [Chloroflexota bacterium]|nr:TrmH family RNA methyltransferase [Chloroflexota bacterium]